MSEPAYDPEQWYVAVNGEQSGPLTLQQIGEEVARGDLDGRDFGWREGMADWLPLPEVVEIDDYLLTRGIGWPEVRLQDDPDETTAALRAVIPIGRTGMSIAAGYLGLISLLFPLAAPVAIPVSILAIRELRQHPGKHGMGRAVFGLVGGILGIFIGVAMVIWMG